LNAVWASFLIGHPRLFRPHLVWPIPWIFRAPPTWALETHFYESEPMQDLLSRPEVFGSYGPRAENPRLIVTAVDVVKGKPVAFDSGQEEPVTAAHVVASGSLPPSYPPKKIGGANAGSYWDGGIWSNTPLREVLNALQTANGVRPVGETRYHACIVDVFPQEAAREPSNSGEVYHRISELTYADKTEYDKKATEWVNEYIDLVQLLESPGTQLPAPLRAKIDRMVRNQELKHYQQIADRTRVHVDITAIPRKAYPSWEMEQISGSLDFSSARIEELIEQGYETGREHLKELQVAQPHLEAAGSSATAAGTAP